jgi:tetratricopeptide (TPR) repeat protein
MRNEICAGCSYHSAAQQYHAERSQRITHAKLPDGHFIVELNPELEEAVNSAMELCERGKTDAAWSQLTRLLQEHPENHMACFAMRVLHAVKGEHNDAIKWCDKAISIYPYFAEAHFNKAVAYQKQLKVAEAVYAYRKVVELGDSNGALARQARSFLDDMAVAIRRTEGVDLDSYIESQSIFDRSFTLMEQGDWSGALSGFRASAQKHERNAPTHGNMGLCLAELGYRAQSLAELDRALEIDPRYEPARTNRAVVEHMEEGVPLKAAGFERIEFGKTQFLNRTGAKP